MTYPEMLETLEERIERLRPYIESTRFALIERDVVYDYESGNHRYAVSLDDLSPLRKQVTLDDAWGASEVDRWLEGEGL